MNPLDLDLPFAACSPTAPRRPSATSSRPRPGRASAARPPVRGHQLRAHPRRPRDDLGPLGPDRLRRRHRDARRPAHPRRRGDDRRRDDARRALRPRRRRSGQAPATRARRAPARPAGGDRLRPSRPAVGRAAVHRGSWPRADRHLLRRGSARDRDLSARPAPPRRRRPRGALAPPAPRARGPRAALRGRARAFTASSSPAGSSTSSSSPTRRSSAAASGPA